MCFSWTRYRGTFMETETYVSDSSAQISFDSNSLLLSEVLHFGKNYKEPVNAKGDWGRAATSKNVLTPVNLVKWAVIFPSKNQPVAKSFCQILQKEVCTLKLSHHPICILLIFVIKIWALSCFSFIGILFLFFWGKFLSFRVFKGFRIFKNFRIFKIS